MPMKVHSPFNSASTEAITVVINTFRRPEIMKGAVEHYTRCNVVKYIYIIWSEETLPSEALKSNFAARKHPEIGFSIQKVDSLNTRFKPIEDAHTDAIFAVDDDMRVSCKDLELGYETWRNSPKNLVGYMPRLHLRGNDGSLTYRCWWYVWWHGAYSIVLTKAAFLHHEYFNLYTNVMPQSVRDLVDRVRNCEDIAMQYLVSNTTSLPPIFVRGSLQDMGVLGGISTQKSILTAAHIDQRSQCLIELDKIYGHDPLVYSHTVITHANNGWVNAPSTWFEYISSDLWSFLYL